MHLGSNKSFTRVAIEIVLFFVLGFVTVYMMCTVYGLTALSAHIDHLIATVIEIVLAVAFFSIAIITLESQNISGIKTILIVVGGEIVLVAASISLFIFVDPDFLSVVQAFLGN